METKYCITRDDKDIDVFVFAEVSDYGCPAEKDNPGSDMSFEICEIITQDGLEINLTEEEEKEVLNILHEKYKEKQEDACLERQLEQLERKYESDLYY